MATEIENRLYEINQAAAEFYHSYLMSEQGETALAYLTNRNVSFETIKTFGIGAAPYECDGLMRHLKEKGYSVNEMAEVGLIRQTQDNQFSDRFRARIMFPVTDAEGRTIAFCGRTLLRDSSIPKYLDVTEINDKGGSLFGLSIVKKYGAEQIVLVEGAFDVVALYQAGIQNAVAVRGRILTARQAALLTKYTKKVVICYDSDMPGKRLTERAITTLRNSNVPAAVITLEDAMDPYDYVTKYGGKELRERIDAAENIQ